MSIIGLLFPQLITFQKLNYFYDLGLILKNLNDIEFIKIQNNFEKCIYFVYKIITPEGNNLISSHILMFAQSVILIISLITFYRYFNKFTSLILGINFIFWSNLTNDFHYEHLVIFFFTIFYIIRYKHNSYISYLFLIPIVFVKDIYLITIITIVIIDLFETKSFLNINKVFGIIFGIFFLIFILISGEQILVTINTVLQRISFDLIIKKFFVLLIISSSFLFINLWNLKAFLIFAPYVLFILITDNPSNLSIFSHHSSFLVIPAVYYLYVERDKLSKNAKKIAVIINVIWLLLFSYFPFNYNFFLNDHSKIYYKNFLTKKNIINDNIFYLEENFEDIEEIDIYVMNNYGYFLSNKKLNFLNIGDNMFNENIGKILILDTTSSIFYDDKLCNDDNYFCSFGNKEKFYDLLNNRLIKRNWRKERNTINSIIYSKLNNKYE